jgi:hypothetical protein
MKPTLFQSVGKAQGKEKGVPRGHRKSFEREKD